MKPKFENIHHFIDLLLPQVLHPGDHVIDATLGNGHDAFKMGEIIGSTGVIYGFDVQKEAILHAKQRLSTLPSKPAIHLFQTGHEMMGSYITDEIDLIMFNLGYLPGGNKEKTTKAETTLLAMDASIHLLKPGGSLFIAVYPGHDEGLRELNTIQSWAENYPQKKAVIAHLYFANQRGCPPQLFVIQKTLGDN